MRSTADLRELWAPACNVPLTTRLIAPGVRVTCHTQVAEAVRALAAVCQAHRYALRTEDTGAYNCRQITGGTSYSLHSYGIALDLNWLSNPYRRDRLVTDMPPALVDGILAIRTKAGLPVWRWGGDWDGDPTTGHSAYDAMHYEVTASPDEIAHGIDWRTVRVPVRDPLVPATYPVLQLGDRGPVVMELQRRILAGDDGIFGPATESAVVLYQQARGLTPDGIVGLQTWTAILTQQPKISTGVPSPVKAPPVVELPEFRDHPPVDLPEALPPRPALDAGLYPKPQGDNMSAIVQAKAWWASKLVWLGAAQIVVGLGEVIATTPVLQGSEVAGWAATVVGALTIALRLVTDKPVASSSKPVKVEA